MYVNELPRCPYNDGVSCRIPAANDERKFRKCFSCAWNTDIGIGERRLTKSYPAQIIESMKKAMIRCREIEISHMRKEYVYD